MIFLVGFLKCKSDRNICIHPSNICDGYIDCPDRADDERFCDLIVACLDQCTCSNHIVLCENSSHEITIKYITKNYKVMLLFKTYMSIDSNMFSQFHNLYILNMSGTFFYKKTLFARMFIGLKSLKVLDMRLTNIEFLPHFLLRDLVNLKKIIFQMCNIAYIGSNVFPHATYIYTYFKIAKCVYQTNIWQCFLWSLFSSASQPKQ